MSPIAIRRYDPKRHEEGLRACFIELQDHKHEFAPEAPTGDELVDIYVPFMIERALESGGVVFVAESVGRLIGFATAVVILRPEPDDVEPFHVELAELSVLRVERSKGAGRQLLTAVEDFARKCKAPSLRVRVDVRNERAHRFYGEFGLERRTISMSKKF